MRLFLVLFLIKVQLAAFAQTHVDTALYTILPYDGRVKMAMDWQFTNARPDSLTIEQIDSAEDLIDSAYIAYIKDADKHIHLLQPLTAYRRQYVALIDDQGDREIWINFFCTAFNHDWRHSAMVVDDGGGCFFQIRINWTKRIVMELQPNGLAKNNLLHSHGDYRNLSHNG
jgi:hypothetical protein